MRNWSKTAERARKIRRIAVEVAQRSGGEGYVNQALGTADILAGIFEIGLKGERDRFVLSPGHYGLALYAANAHLYDYEELCTYGQDGSRFEQSPLEDLPGVEVTGGSLGQGLSQAVGLALGERMLGKHGRIFCLVSDGELQEGQTWEALMSAGHLQLANLVVLIDRNGIQVDGATRDIVDLEPLADKLTAFRLEAIICDGHDLGAIEQAILRGMDDDRKNPLAIVFDTMPGKGVPEFEAARYPHYINAAPEVWSRALEGLRVQDE